MKYGLIAERVGHSFSAEIHKQLFGYEYELKAIAKDDLDEFMRSRDFDAINVTIPYKQTVIPYLDYVDQTALDIGAVNTIVNRDGKLCGANTDLPGLCALINREGIDVKDKKVLVLGSGGTSKTALYAAKHLGCCEAYRVSRSSKDGCITYKEAAEYHTDAEIIINTTPAGMFPDIGTSAIDISLFPKLEGVVDAVYNPLRSKLVCDALKKGIKAAGGLYMLVAQAAYAAEMFVGKKVVPHRIDEIYSDLFMSKQNIVFVGMPGSGKSTTATLVAEALGLEYIDTDDEIFKKTGKPAHEIIQESGEKAFRDIESEVVKEVSALQGKVIATGGGAILRQENVDLLRENGRIYFLDRHIDEIHTSSDRPLSSNRDDLEKRFNERYSIYLSCCDCRIQCVDGKQLNANAVLNDINKEKARISKDIAAKEPRVRSKDDKMKILVINGPNLNMLGIREPSVYGSSTYRDLCNMINDYANEKGIEVCIYQSNHEGDIVTEIQNAYGEYDGIVINPAAYTHTSVAILDALKAVSIPTVEVHISDVSKREDFRQISYVRQACRKTICGHGFNGYLEAIDFLIGEDNEC